MAKRKKRKKYIWIGREDSGPEPRYYVSIYRMRPGIFACQGSWICKTGAEYVVGDIRLKNGQQAKVESNFKVAMKTRP